MIMSRTRNQEKLCAMKIFNLRCERGDAELEIYQRDVVEVR